MANSTTPEPRSARWYSYGAVATVVAMLAVYWASNRVAPMTLAESRHVLEQRIGELALHCAPSERLGAAEFTARLGADTWAAQELDNLFGSDEMEAIDVALLGPWDKRDATGVEPVARAAALAHPPLRELLQRWVTRTGEASKEEIPEVQYQMLHQYALAALADASYRADEPGTTLWITRIIELVEIQLLRRSFNSWAVASSMLGIFADHLENEQGLIVGRADQSTSRELVLGLGPCLERPEGAFALNSMQIIQAVHDSLPTLRNDVERAKTVGFVLELHSWQTRVLATLLIESRPERERALAALSTELQSLSDGARVLAASPEGLWRIYEDATHSLDRIAHRLEEP